jgi:hypothetical protein
VVGIYVHVLPGDIENHARLHYHAGINSRILGLFDLFAFVIVSYMIIGFKNRRRDALAKENIR